MSRMLGLAFLLLALVAGAQGRAQEITNCDAAARADIEAAAAFISGKPTPTSSVGHMSQIVDQYTFLTEQQRQEVVRKWVGLNIHCSDSETVCEGNTTGRAHGSIGNRINICYYTAVRLGHTLCDLVGTMLHEQGHAHGFRMVPGHNDPNDFVRDNDPIYRMGSIAESYCRAQATAGNFTNSVLRGRGSRAIGDACTQDLQCASSRCSQNQCVCDQNADCPTGQSCFRPVTARNYCASTSLPINAACTADAQCLSDQCEGDVCVCRHDSDCPTGQVCRTPVTGRNFCERSQDVGARPIGSACNSNAECLSNTCEFHTCVCNSDGDCPSAQECYRPIGERNICRPVALPINAACQRDSQCRSGRCEGDRCVCRHDADCPSGLVCRTPVFGTNRCER
jgi:Cys-rich repeat protein